MCTVLFSYGQLKEWPLIFLANRDEFYDRPTKSAARWEDHPEIVAGRDLVGGGTWLGITDSGRIAAVTNYRDPLQEKGTRSRGLLVTDYLLSDYTPEGHLASVSDHAGEFTGFNLLAGWFKSGSTELSYFSNRSEGIARLEPGLYGLSNHLLDTPWPKVERGKRLLEKALRSGSPDIEELFGILADRTPADDDSLPDTGVGHEIEKLLSSIFIESPVYGTRSSTVVMIDGDGRMDLQEKVYV